MKICFLLTHIPDPRTNKRIDLFKKDHEVFVVCCRRKSQNIWNPDLASAEYRIYDIDLPGIKHPIKRFFASKRYYNKAKKALQSIKPDTIYVGGLDSLQIAADYKKKQKGKNIRVFFEVADLRECFIEKPKSLAERITKPFILMLEKKLFKYVDELVLTSAKFFDVHYNKLIASDKVFYMPNTPDKKVFATYKKKDNGDFTVGFIGGIRYLNQMKLLVDACSIVKCNVLFAGAGGTKTEFEQMVDYCKGNPNVFFYGKYNYNDDIAKLYGMVDCVYAVYDADNANVRIALPNKLYESIVCELPIIVAKNTYLEERVKTLGIGFSVGHTSCDEVVAVLKALKENRNLIPKESFESAKEEIDLDRYNKSLKALIEERR